jgi:hypothetical protein
MEGGKAGEAGVWGEALGGVPAGAWCGESAADGRTSGEDEDTKSSLAGFL